MDATAHRNAVANVNHEDLEEQRSARKLNILFVIFISFVPS